MKKIWLVLVLLISFTICEADEMQNKDIVSVQPEKPKFKTLTEEKETWIKKFNEKDKSIRNIYDKKANFIINEEFIENKNMEKYFEKLLSIKGTIESRKILDTKEYDKTRLIEKGEYLTGEKRIYYINVWEKSKKNWYITLELLMEIEKDDVEVKMLDSSREKYNELGTTKDIKGFVKNIFDENGAYFHNGEFFIGNETVYKIFNTNMEGSGEFTMKFEKEKVVPISDNIVCDYGKYFNNDSVGRYFFIWKRQSDNSWKIYLDLCIF